MQKIKFQNINFIKKRKGVSIILLIFSVIAIFSLAGFVVDLGIILNCRYELQKLAETTALTAITDYEAYEDTNNFIKYPPAANIITSADNNFNAFIKSNSFLLLLQNITHTVTFGNTIQSRYSRAIKIDTSAVAKTYFLNIIGIRSIKLQASAAAMHAPVYLQSGNILTGDSAATGGYKDTDIREPVGGSASNQIINGQNYTLPAITNINTDFSNIYGIQDAAALSLGAGGYVMIKLPATLIDGKGFDLQVIEAGNSAGYFVFAGNDHDPANPYIDAANSGAGIDWVNISCTGTPVGTATTGRAGSYYQNVGGAMGNQAKFYGSGYFDLAASCSNGYSSNVKSAKYLKIIDDNTEDGFTLKDPVLTANIDVIPSFFSGQNSSLTPGANIDAVAVEHHSRLISLSDFSKDTDSDGLIDIFENSLGLNSNGSSDGSGANNDALKYWGFTNAGTSGNIQDTPTAALRIGYPARSDNLPKIYINMY